MIFYIVEFQSGNGTGAAIVTTKATQQEAEQVFHTIMAAAAVSSVPQHGAMIMTSDMFVLKSELAYRPAATSANEL